MNNIQIFNNTEFGEIRVVEKNGESWFVGKDVADALGYSDTQAMTRRLDSDDLMTDKMSGMNMKSTLINESGLYSAILGSKLKTAKKFKRWVTSEVLPSIRKHGGYLNNQENLTNEQLLANAMKLAEDVILEKNKKIEELETTISLSSTITVCKLAEQIRQRYMFMKENVLFEWLRSNGYLINTGAYKNMPTQMALDAQLLLIEENIGTCGEGKIVITRTTKVTGKGQLYFKDKYLAYKCKSLDIE